MPTLVAAPRDFRMVKGFFKTAPYRPHIVKASRTRESGVYTVEALAKGLRILALFSDRRPALRLTEIVAMTAKANTPSQAVMRKLGMTRDMSGDFGHPFVPTSHVMHNHVLYRLNRLDGVRS